MQHAGFSARIMKARRLTGNGPHGLPPGNPVDVFPVDAFEQPLSSWIAGPGNYVVPVDPDWGLWFDWTDNDWTNTAVLLSIKGMNPITGQRTNGFMLERYKERCPIHDEPFKDGLFCEKCNFKWPDQNYVTYPNKLWWDGFRTADGKVRQFFFTEDLAKSVPELVIGKEDTVPAFGFAFYRPKTLREVINQKHLNVTHQSPIYFGSTKCSSSVQDSCFALYSTKSTTKSAQRFGAVLKKSSWLPITDGPATESVYFSNATACAAGGSAVNLDSTRGGNIIIPESHQVPDVQYRAADFEHKPRTTEVGVGAGAEILQSLTVDPLNVSDWKDKPDSVMRLFFVFVDQFNAIKEKGMKDLTGELEGFLSGLPVG
jgi:hypothetical protein